jgi:Lar family restriction alleviation protein
MTDKTTETPELKPCPFCGGTDLIENLGADRNAHCATYCKGCEARGPAFYTGYEEDSVEWHENTWNTRSTPPQGEIERLLEGVPENYSLSLHGLNGVWMCGIDSPNKDEFADGYDFFGKGDTPAEAIKAALDRIKGGV